ncbi:MAG: polysaccharide biosynthesis protein [Clostridiales bacterium]|nr:polysaccharide biosynthesis protein [Clostridiales bacterium]
MDRNTILHGTFILTISSIIVRFMGFIYRIFLSRAIGPEGMGLIQLVMPGLFTSLALVSAGIPIAVSRLIAEKNAINDYTGMRRVLFTALGFVVTLSLIVCMLLVLKVNYISYNILKEPRVRGALLTIYPAIIMMSISSVFKGYFYGIKNFFPPAFSEIIEELVAIILLFFILNKVNHLDVSVQVTIVAFDIVISELFSLLYLNYSYYKTKDKVPISFSYSKTSSSFPLTHILKISTPITLIRLMSSIGSSISSILLPQRLIKSGLDRNQAVSLLGILNGMVMPLLFLPFTFVGSLAVVMIPNLSEDLVRKNWDRIRSKTSKAIFITSILALPFSAIMTALAKPIGILLYNQEEVGSLLQSTAFISGINALCHTLSAILNGLGKQNKTAMYAVLGETIDILSIFFLVAIPSLRIHGYIIGFISSTLIVLILQFITLYKDTKLPILWSHWFFKPIFAALLTASVSRLSYLWLSNHGHALFTSFFISATLGILIYIFTLYTTGSLIFIVNVILPTRKSKE